MIGSSIISEGHGPLVQQFFSQNGAGVLLCAYHNERLYMTTGIEQLPRGADKLIYVIRIAEKGKNLSNFDQDLSIGVFSSEHVSSLVILLQNVFNATIESQDLTRVLTESQVNYFLGTCKRFVDNLQKCGLIVENQLQLNVPQDAALQRVPAELNAQSVQKLLSDYPEQL